jgi:hypothetical protein
LSAAGALADGSSFFLGLDEINRTNLYATPTDGVRQLTGRPPRTLEEYIERNNSAFSNHKAA